MKKIISFLSLFILLTSCSNDGAIANLNSTGLLFEPETNKVLLLKVDYTTNTFEGEIHFPTDFQPASSFEFVNTFAAIDLPPVENIFNPNNEIFDYTNPLNQVIYLSKVIEYRASNPNASAKIFLYQPSVGIGDPATWKWIIIFKN